MLFTYKIIQLHKINILFLLVTRYLIFLKDKILDHIMENEQKHGHVRDILQDVIFFYLESWNINKKVRNFYEFYL